MSKHQSSQIKELKAQVKELGALFQSRADTGYYDEGQRRDPRLLSNKAEAVGLLARKGSEEDDDIFGEAYGQYPDLIEPPFPFPWLWRTFQQCDTLHLCCRAMVSNIENPADLAYLGPKKQKNEDLTQSQRITLNDFFSRINEKQSLVSLRRKLGLDRQVTKNGFLEVIRNSQLEQGENGSYLVSPRPERLYYIPSTYMRVTKLDQTLVDVDVTIPRQGQLRKITIQRQFRRFARINPVTQKLTWFKEFGDPRTLDAGTGEFGPTSNPASEIWWFRDNYAGFIYGIPEWLSVIWDIGGRYQAMWLGFDHVDQGALPPVALATDGEFTPATKQQLNNLFKETRDPAYYNRPVYIELKKDPLLDIDADGSGKTNKIQLLKLRDPNYEDYFFEKYRISTEEAIRRIFRLPPVLTGVAGNDTYASAYTSMEVAESQVFGPARQEFDEKITTELIQNEFGIYNWALRTRQSKIGDKETFYRAVGALSRAGALTINDIRELANQLLGTDFAPFEGDLYNEPSTLTTTLAGNGLVSYEKTGDNPDDPGRLVFISAMAEASQVAGEQFKSVASGKVKKEDVSELAKALAMDIIKNLTGIQESYKPPTETEIEFELLPTGSEGGL
jgi:capsid portal protein